MADGHLPGSATVFDHYPGVDNLDPVLLSHLRQAAQAAAPDQVTFVVNSGWRTPAYQQQLFDDAVRQYGSAGQAAQWVAPPDKSLHVSGQAVDLGWTASDWLAHHGAAYGLCQIYVNEPWHYELRPQASSTRCPLMYADATADPRLR
jgi:LAS superfamily LD-carboxypeptidase LdcB